MKLGYFPFTKEEAKLQSMLWIEGLSPMSGSKIAGSFNRKGVPILTSSKEAILSLK
jgi:hypothetical protein